MAVVADPRTLATLSERDYRGGMAEAVKHGLIADASYFDWIEREADALLSRDATALTRLVRRSVEIKADVVAEDEREAGRRAILNAGHTVAHALEQVTGYDLPHGEAVALGLVAECSLAGAINLAPPGLAGRVSGLLMRLGLPVKLAHPVSADRLIDAMAADKKNRSGRVRFALPRALGALSPEEGWTSAAPAAAIRTAIAAIT